MRRSVALPLHSLVWVFLTGSLYCQRPSVVNIGAIFTFNSVIGRVAKTAMEAAVSDVNADPRILNGTELRLHMEDANCSVFMGSVEVGFSIRRNRLGRGEGWVVRSMQWVCSKEGKRAKK